MEIYSANRGKTIVSTFINKKRELLRLMTIEKTKLLTLRKTVTDFSLQALTRKSRSTPLWKKSKRM